jgi:uncharacterized protein YndB with AHSA1/START domain
MAGPKVGTREVVITRVFEAPVERVWKAMTDPEQVMRWWGPTHFTSPSCKMDFREGGTSLFCMRSPDGVDMYTTWKYQKIVPLQRIEFIQNLADRDGQRLDPAAIGAPADFPRDVRNTLTFKAIGGKTEITITQIGFPEGQTTEWAVAGLNQSLDKLAESLKLA